MYFVAAVIFLYLLFLIVLIYFWNRPAGKEGFITREVFISVVVPARDEPDLHLLLLDLHRQTLAPEDYEVIVVDDHSLKKILPSERGERVLYQKEDVNGKKAALTFGIEQATGNVIATIDADCRVGKGFLKNIHEVFINNDVVLSPGFIRYAPVKGLFEKMQALETSAVMGMGLALHRMGMTSLSNGANLAFTKRIWLEVGGYQKHQHIASGDDEFFVQDVVGKHPHQVIFRTERESIVSTTANKTFTEFMHQRLRWAGKWRKYKDIRMKGIAAAVFLIHLMICAGLILIFNEHNEILTGLFLLKVLLEGYLILHVSKKLESHFSLVHFIILQFLYSPYVVIFGLAANFVPYKWKDRYYSH
jgi:biofilm PGA synthesis N-glycosyltransferase PgaC